MSIIQVQPANARLTISKLLAIHHKTLDDIDAGKQFFKDGQNITKAMRHNVMIELGQCRIALDALDALRAGDVKRAANLFDHIQERTFNGH